MRVDVLLILSPPRLNNLDPALPLLRPMLAVPLPQSGTTLPPGVLKNFFFSIAYVVVFLEVSSLVLGYWGSAVCIHHRVQHRLPLQNSHALNIPPMLSTELTDLHQNIDLPFHHHR